MKKLSTRQIFAQMLIKLRKSRNISRKKLAEDLGVSVASIGYYEKAERVPDIEVLVKIADYFNVTCDELLRGVKSPDKNVYKDLWLSDKALDTLRQLKETEPICEETQISSVFEFFNYWLEQDDLFIDFMCFYYRYSIKFPMGLIFGMVDIPRRDELIIDEFLGAGIAKTPIRHDNTFAFMIMAQLIQEYASYYYNTFAYDKHSISSWREYEEWYGEKLAKLLEDLDNGKHNPKEE